MNLKFHNLRAIEQGAICGLLFGVLSEVGWHSLYIYERYSYKPTNPELVIDFASYPYNWWTLPLLWLVLVALSSYLVHRYLVRYVKSSIWLWQVIGIVVVLEFCVFSFSLVVYGWYSQFGDWKTSVLWEGIIDETLRV